MFLFCSTWETLSFLYKTNQYIARQNYAGHIYIDILSSTCSFGGVGLFTERKGQFRGQRWKGSVSSTLMQQSVQIGDRRFPHGELDRISHTLKTWLSSNCLHMSCYITALSGTRVIISLQEWSNDGGCIKRILLWKNPSFFNPFIQILQSYCDSFQQFSVKSR